MFTLDGGGGTSIFGQGQPYFWGTRAITPNDPMPGLFKWLQGDVPGRQDRRASSAGTSASRTTASSRRTSSRRSPTAATSTTACTSWCPSAARTSRRCCPKVKANEPDILLVSIYGQDPGSFANQAATAGLDGVRDLLRVHARRRQRLEGHVRLRRLHVRLRLLRRQEPGEPAGQEVRRGLRRRVRRGPRLLRRQLLRERVRDVGGACGASGPRTRRPRSPARRSTRRCRRTSRSSASTAATSATVGTYTLDPTTHSVIKREMGVFEYKGGEVTPKAFFGIGGADYRHGLILPRPSPARGPTATRLAKGRGAMLAVDLRDVPPADRRRVLPGLQLRPARGRLRADPRRHRPLPLRLRVHVHARRVPGVHVHVPRGDLPFWPAAVLGVLLAGVRRRGDRAVRLPPARRATPGRPRCWRCSSPRSASASPASNMIRLFWGSETTGATSARRRSATTSGTRSFLNFDVWQARRARSPSRSCSR